MQAKRINNWLNDSELKSCLEKQNIIEWLNEEGSITAKISLKSKFKLKILSDDIGIAEDEEYLALDIASDEVRIRDVV
jgi:chorismate-pyruvate lyase